MPSPTSTAASVPGAMAGAPARTVAAIFWGGGLAGIFDMGWTSAALGLVSPFTIAFTAAAVYYLASRVIRAMVEHAVLCGLLCGELVFLFMYFVVLPLSRLGPAHFSIVTYITGPIGHTFLVGLPIAFSVRRFAGSRRA